MARIFQGERTLLSPAFAPVEKLIYRLCGIAPNREMRWTTYCIALLAFNFVGFLLLYGILRLQHVLPLSPMKLPGMPPDLAFNTAVSFATNTNWQAYPGESTASYFSQMVGLTFHNFVSAATGVAMAVAVFRGFARRSAGEIGNFWVDMTRSCLYVLLPLSLVLSLFLVSQGVIQNLSPYTTASTVQGASQTIPNGPTASQVAIKQLGTNGGGFFNANSGHPFENPTPLSNFVEMLAILLIPAALTYTFGRFVGNQRQGWALFAAMFLLFIVAVGAVYWSEQLGNPITAAAGVERSGGNMEGKEVRFGIANSALWAVATTDASNGSVNSMHDSFTPLGGGVLLLNIGLGEVVFGGIGVGVMSMLVFAILAVFIAGLMVGRTPEYLGKKVESREMKMAMLSVLFFAATVLCVTAVAVATSAGLAGRLNTGPHGFSEILYAAHSAAGNNGSAFAGLNANTPFYNTLLGIAMLVGRYLVYIPILALAGSMAGKRTVPETSGTFPTTGALFVGLVIGVIVIVGALTFFPAYSLGPIVEHFLARTGGVL